MTGTIKDAAGQALVGASVSALHQPSGTKYSGLSQSSGQFTISNMRVGGPYLVEISYVGHETQKVDEVYLRLAEAYVLDVIMQKRTRPWRTW